MAVLVSILNTLVKGNCSCLSRFRYDLFAAPRLLLEGIDFLANKALTVHYEELARVPEKVTKLICSYLNMELHTTMIEYGLQKAPSGSMGDPVKINKHSSPVPDYIYTWIDAFTSRQPRHFAESYLEALGPEVFRRLGYSFYDLKTMLVS